MSGLLSVTPEVLSLAATLDRACVVMPGVVFTEPDTDGLVDPAAGDLVGTAAAGFELTEEAAVLLPPAVRLITLDTVFLAAAAVVCCLALN